MSGWPPFNRAQAELYKYSLRSNNFFLPTTPENVTVTLYHKAINYNTKYSA